MQQARDRRGRLRTAGGKHSQGGGDAVGREEEVFAGTLLYQDCIEIEGKAIDSLFKSRCLAGLGRGDCDGWKRDLLEMYEVELRTDQNVEAIAKNDIADVIFAAAEMIGTFLAANFVTTAAAVERVVAASAEEQVALDAAFDLIVAAAAVDAKSQMPIGGTQLHVDLIVSLA